ncbi:MAG: ComF family protein [Ramlibacter sp.]|nr:ComF family protein [Ramlibacter sp.]
MFRELIARAEAAIPGQCAICRAWPSRTLCEPCVAQLGAPQPRCATCALVVPAGLRQCGPCRASPPPLDACLAAVPYAYPWSGCIADFKFHGQPGWARALATLLRSTPWADPALEASHHVVPMPLSRERLRERGFNQALLLARQIAPAKTDATLLLRVRDTPPQRALDRTVRQRNVQDAFAVDPLSAPRLRNRRVVLVDDVMTSGASLHAAARALREAGVAHITALVLARTE